MSHQALSIVYRPLRFDDVVEQDVVKKILKEQLSTNQVKRVLLFTGGAGTGKTTDARIFANELESIKANIIEINAADHTGVDDMRLIIDQAKTKPLQGKYKIFIIDEVHMLTVQAQNSLLKLLEEPPSYCVFIMCTTDPQKILSTILSRAYRYDFQLISYEGIVKRLEYILQQEQIREDGCKPNSWDIQALQYLAKLSRGHMRDAITTLDKVLSFTKDITIDAVIKVLGVTGYDLMFKILNALYSKDNSTLLINLEELHRSGKDLKLFVKNFLSFLLDINKFITFQNFEYIDIPQAYEPQLKSYNQSHRSNLKQLIAKLMQLNTDMKWETNPYILLESTLLLEVL